MQQPVNDDRVAPDLGIELGEAAQAQKLLRLLERGVQSKAQAQHAAARGIAPSRKNLVQGRYLFALIIVAVCLILNLVCGGIILLFSQEPISLLIYSSLAVAGVSLLLISLIMPIAFRFGVDRGRIYAVVIALCIVGAMVAAQNYLYALDRLIAMLDRLLPLVPFLLAAVVFISYRLSCRICSKKEY